MSKGNKMLINRIAVIGLAVVAAATQAGVPPVKFLPGYSPGKHYAGRTRNGLQHGRCDCSSSGSASGKSGMV